MSFYQMINRWGRICLQCGSYRVGVSLFCKTCEQSLCQQRKSESLWWPYRTDLVRGCAHFAWVPNQSRALSLLIENLKGEQMTEAWEFWSRQVIQNMISDKYLSAISSMSKNPILIPAPSSKDRVDHAFVFAQKISQITSWPMNSCLKKMSGQSQKQLGKLQRQLVEIESSENFSDDQPVLFIDDVVTTGATAKAAYLALGRPRNFFVLALAHRHS